MTSSPDLGARDIVVETVEPSPETLRDEELEAATEGVAPVSDAVQVPYLATDRSGTIRRANPLAADLLGVPGESLNGKPLAAYVADRCAFRARLHAPVGAGVSRWELTLTPRGGPETPVQAILRSSEGAAGLLHWTFIDVSDRVAAEREAIAIRAELELHVQERTADLEEERARLEAVLRQLPAGVLFADAETRQIVGANDQVGRILGPGVGPGYSLDESEVRLRYPDGRWYAREELPLIRALTTGEIVEGERMTYERPDGAVRLLDVNASPVRDATGRIVAAVTVFQDVTDRLRRERAERDFVTNAAHELQTPLAAITSAVEVLQAGAKEQAPDRDRFLGHIQTETQRLTRLVHALLVLARSQTGVQQPSRERFKLRPLLDEVALSVYPAKGVEIRVSCPARLTVTSNRELVEQALTSLAANAAKYTDAGEIRLRADWKDGSVTIEVSDTGPGIPAAEQQHVFERFYRVGVRTGDGFGLGLAIARQAVEALGGTIEVRPNSGGTTVRITLPAR